uniref:Uncharacterized protein n=1 Tax=Lepeophtheirus salmonis TaxID=72036 RepID=A0A0K2UHX7_LEPSM
MSLSPWGWKGLRTWRDFSLGKTREQTRHLIPLGELEPSRMRWLITSALGRPLFPESPVLLGLLLLPLRPEFPLLSGVLGQAKSRTFSLQIDVTEGLLLQTGLPGLNVELGGVGGKKPPTRVGVFIKLGSNIIHSHYDRNDTQRLNEFNSKKLEIIKNIKRKKKRFGFFSFWRQYFKEFSSLDTFLSSLSRTNQGR